MYLLPSWNWEGTGLLKLHVIVSKTVLDFSSLYLLTMAESCPYAGSCKQSWHSSGCTRRMEWQPDVILLIFFIAPTWSFVNN